MRFTACRQAPLRRRALRQTRPGQLWRRGGRGQALARPAWQRRRRHFDPCTSSGRLALAVLPPARPALLGGTATARHHCWHHWQPPHRAWPRPQATVWRGAARPAPPGLTPTRSARRTAGHEERGKCIEGNKRGGPSQPSSKLRALLHLAQLLHLGLEQFVLAHELVHHAIHPLHLPDQTSKRRAPWHVRRQPV